MRRLGWIAILVGGVVLGQNSNYHGEPCSLLFEVIPRSERQMDYTITRLVGSSWGDALSHCRKLQCRALPYDTYEFQLTDAFSGDVRVGTVAVTDLQQLATVKSGPTGDISGVRLSGIVRGLPSHDRSWIRLDDPFGQQSMQVLLDSQGRFSFREVARGKWVALVLSHGDVIHMEVVEIRGDGPSSSLSLRVGPPRKAIVLR